MDFGLSPKEHIYRASWPHLFDMGVVFSHNRASLTSSALAYICFIMCTAFSVCALPCGNLGDDITCWMDHCIINSSNSSEMKYLALSLIILSGAPMSHNIDLSAFTISEVCRLFSWHSKIQHELLLTQTRCDLPCMSVTSIPYISPGWVAVTWNFGALAGIIWFSLHKSHSWHILSMSLFQFGQKIKVWLNSFDFTMPRWASCILLRNDCFSPIGMTILSCKKIIPSTICNSNPYGK